MDNRALERRFLVEGVVQGVGFRPLCARIAARVGVGGSVRNVPEGVELVLRGKLQQIELFLELLREELPPLARIDSLREVESREIEAKTVHPFEIGESRGEGNRGVIPPPDVRLCADCLREMMDPSDRRHRYPFINCTDCGPRFTIIKSLPYDRKNTTMAAFEMCEACSGEYHDPLSRRYHAQPNACPRCGPRLRLLSAEGKLVAEGEDALSEAKSYLARGNIGAVKGLGGFHLAVDPSKEGAVLELRRRKGRPHKPFALMVRSIEVARALCKITPLEERELLSFRAPIVLAEKRDPSLWPWVAPGQRRFGVMLPYTPLHHLLMEDFEALVMTSANVSGEPIAKDEEEIWRHLRGLVDFVLSHDRPIHVRCDDSVELEAGGKVVLVRRSRGYVPSPLRLELGGDEVVLGLGAEEKATFSLLKGSLLFPSQYLGDLKDQRTVDNYSSVLEHFLKLFDVQPDVLACDLHPRYVSTQLGEELSRISGIPLFRVQHHHAHLAACLAENGMAREKALGLILDGTGYGEDGSVWGGELLLGDASSSIRVGHLLGTPMPGGEAAIKNPYRMAVSYLHASMGERGLEVASALFEGREGELSILKRILERNLGPITTSCGRLFDGVSALLGIREQITYEAQAAMELEALCGDLEEADPLPYGMRWEDKGLVLDWRPTIEALAERRLRGEGKDKLSSSFHLTLCRALRDMVLEASKELGVRRVCLSGGVFFNKVMSERLPRELERVGLTVLTHRHLSPGDECVSAGQAVAAALRSSRTRG